MSRIFLAMVAMLLVPPLAASEAPAYVGVGSGTVDQDWEAVPLPVCERFHIEVAAYLVAGEWRPEAHYQSFSADGIPCNAGHLIGGDAPFGMTMEYTGSPETGFTMSYRNSCLDHLVTIAPFDHATDVRIAFLDSCAPISNTWLNGTVVFG